jgi:hypothetical protein
MKTNAFERYCTALRDIPPSGGGGCHAALLGIANLGRRAGVDRNQIALDLAANVRGSRKVPQTEIAAAVNKAFDSSPMHTPDATARMATPAINGKKLFKAIVERGAPFAEEDLWESSPVKIDWPLERDGIEILRRLYRPDERVFIGTRYDAGLEHVLPVSEWIRIFERGIAIEHIIANPLTGSEAARKKAISAIALIVVWRDSDLPSWSSTQCRASYKFYSGRVCLRR